MACNSLIYKIADSANVSIDNLQKQVRKLRIILKEIELNERLN